MRLDLECRYPRGATHPFRVELLDHALHHLIEDTRKAYRVYELFALRRPGDVWKYLWVQLIEVPERVMERYQRARAEHQGYRADHPWPAYGIPLVEFDRFFYWCWDDTEPEDECWLSVREGRDFQLYATQRFAKVREAQAGLQTSDDPLIRHEICALQAINHPYDYLEKMPFERTLDSYRSPTCPKRTPGYYTQLQALLARPEIRKIRSVASRGDDDFETIRLLCTEQRRRAESLGISLVEALPICLLSDGVPEVTAWQAFVIFYYEGLGYGDLFLHYIGDGFSFKELAKYRRFHWVLCYQDEGEIRDYQRTIGDGWVCYEGQHPDWDYNKSSSFHHTQYIERYHRWNSHQEST